MTDLSLVRRVAQIDQRLSALETRERAPLGKARAYRATNQTITTATPTAISFSGVRFDVGGFWSAGSPTRLTLPFSTTYAIGASVRFAAIGTGYRQAYILLDGATILGSAVEQNPTAAVDADLNVPTTEQTLSAGSYIELVVYQNRGADLNILTAAAFSPELWIFCT